MIKNFLQRRVWSLSLILVLGFCAYCLILPGQFKTLDDHVSIIKNAAIRNFHNIPLIFQKPFFEEGFYYRPLVELSFMTDYHLGNGQAFPFYLTNLLLHLLTSFMVFMLVDRMLKNRFVALLTGLLFCIHPIQWEAVSNIAGRSILLCGFFGFSSFYFFLKVIHHQRIRDIGLTFIFFILSLLSKESAVMLPFGMITYTMLFQKELIKHPSKIRSVLLGYIAILMSYLALRSFLDINQRVLWPDLQTQWFAIITFFQGVIVYLRLIIWPIDLHFDRSIVLLNSWGDLRLWMTIVFYVLMGASAVFFRKRISTLVWFCLLWFGFQLFPVAQIVSALQLQPGYILLSEHFMYIASLGIFLLVSIGLQKFIEWARKVVSVKIIYTLIIAFFAFLFLECFEQNIYASNEVAMLRRALQYEPYNLRTRHSLAIRYGIIERYDLAEQEFLHILTLDKNNVSARIGLGIVLCKQGFYKDGIKIFESIKYPGKLQAVLDENLKLSREIYLKSISDQEKP